MGLRRAKGTVLIKGSAFVAGALFLSTMVFSGQAHAIHKGAGDLVCGNCHTMHNSQGGNTLGGLADGSLVLLRGPVSSRAEIHKFCLQCHASNGPNATVLQPPQNVMAPKVWSSAAWTSDDAFNLIGSGGNFSPELDSSWNAVTTNLLGRGHSLGASNVTPPGGDAPIAEFSCVNCHDPHGTSDPANANINIFRNLRVNPTGASAYSGIKLVNNPSLPYREHRSYVGGVNGTYFGGTELDGGGNVIWPIYRGTLTGTPTTDSANSNSYGTGWDDGNYPAVATMSRWCAQCHDSWHEAISTTNGPIWGAITAEFSAGTGPDWRRHPVNAMVPRASSQGCATGCHVSLMDRSTYDLALVQAGKGLPVTASSYYSSNAYYLPTSTTGAGAGLMDTPVTGDNHKVFCLSCHFAHGGPYNDNLRWDYSQNVSTGNQTGNGVPSNKGCQLCHNRGG